MVAAIGLRLAVGSLPEASTDHALLPADSMQLNDWIQEPALVYVEAPAQAVAGSHE
jgi:hypothetical protein